MGLRAKPVQHELVGRGHLQVSLFSDFAPQRWQTNQMPSRDRNTTWAASNVTFITHSPAHRTSTWGERHDDAAVWFPFVRTLVLIRKKARRAAEFYFVPVFWSAVFIVSRTVLPTMITHGLAFLMGRKAFSTGTFIYTIPSSGKHRAVSIRTVT
jgi:hypothetical protein